MNRKLKRELKKSASNKVTGLLAGLLAVNSIGTVVAASLDHNKIHKLNAEAVSNATGNTSGDFDGVSMNLDQELNDNGDGTYSIKLKTSSNLKFEDMSVKMTKVKSGYYKAEQDGKYFVEVFGGNGGSGQDTIYSRGGKGGEGGHIYATVELKAGDVLYYTIGGNGQRTLSNDTGGGANGDGGDHGDNGSYYVGGGGGYTAVYKFGSDVGEVHDKDYFNDTYLNSDGTLKLDKMVEADRTSKYIMIAGGGGGGGAGNAFSLVDKAVRAPDGGKAGDLTSTYGVLGNEYPVEGKFYSGHDGYSSGKSQEFVGKGGTYQPGKVNETWLSFFEGKKPNDWAGSNNSRLPGGSGGSGNLRGGAGGAGYAGGSGGIMTGLLVGTNVGGGGGGSSFVASSVHVPQSDEEDYEFVTNVNESDVGGAVYITYIPTSTDFEYLKNLSATATVSKYFTIQSVEASNSIQDGSHPAPEVEPLVGNTFTVNKLQSTPTTQSELGVDSTIKLTVRPVDGFMGGNDVPLFTTNSLTYNFTKSGASKSASIQYLDRCSYVNVPYAFDIEVQNYTKSGSVDDPCTELKARDLYKDAGYIAEMSTKPDNYAFIDSVSNYEVWSSDETTKYNNDQQLFISDTTEYVVKYRVIPVPGDNKAIVGEKLESKVYSKNAKVKIVSPSLNSLNGMLVTSKKTLNYNATDESYVLNLNVEISKNDEAIVYSGNQNYTTGTYTVPVTGDYYVQLWGGRGGRGGNASLGSHKGGLGGEPGYIGKLIHLEKNQVIAYNVGKSGSKGSNGSGLTRRGAGGNPGYGTYISLDGTVILGAAGSGGGGGAVYTEAFGGPGDNGAAVDNKEANFEKVTFNASKLKGEDDNRGTWLSTDTSAVNPGKSFLLQSFFDGNTPSPGVVATGFASTDYTVPEVEGSESGKGGAFYITQVLPDIDISTDFADNFKLETDGVRVDNASGYTIDGADVSGVALSGRNNEFNISYTLKPDYTVTYGGYDIKLLDGITISQVDLNDYPDDDSIEVEPEEVTDYANVRINPQILDDYGFALTTNDINYIAGSGAIDTNSLYETEGSLPATNGLATKEANAEYSSTITPEGTKDYQITYGVQGSEGPHVAVVGPTIDPVVLTGYSHVEVYHTVQFDLTNIGVDAVPTDIKVGETTSPYYTFNPSNGYKVTLIPNAGMELPETIHVFLDGVEYTGTGLSFENYGDERTLSLTAEALVGVNTIKISGEAKERTFKLHYLVALDVSGVQTKDYSVDVKAGLNGEEFEQVLNDLLALYPEGGGEIPSYNGYVYTIEYPEGIGEENKLTEMPAYDVWINGTYHPNPHKLTIEYYSESGTKLGESYIDDVDTCYNKKDIDVVSPEFPGYAPLEVRKGSYSGEVTTYNPLEVQFTMPDADTTLCVVYKEIVPGTVTINFACKDSNINLPKPVTLTGASGEEYKYVVNPIAGYEASVSEVSGTFNDEEGVYVTVTFTPKQYTLSFDSQIEDPDYVEFDSREVFYGHDIGFTLEEPTDTYDEKEFIPLPTPVKVGYNFLGWFLNGVLVTGLSIYDVEGDATLVAMWELQITPVTEDSCLVTFNPEEGIYDGSAQEPGINVVVDGDTLTEGVDYEVIFPEDMTNAGTKIVTIEFKGKYSGTVEKEYVIAPKDTTSSLDIEDIASSYVYTGSTITPEPYVKDGDTELIEGVDFEYAYKDNVNKGTAELTIKFIGNYANTPDEVINFDIVAKDVNADGGSITVEGLEEEYTYTGSAITPEPTVKYNDGNGHVVTLVKDQDYILTYSNNTNVGEATITVKLINNYCSDDDSKTTFNFEIVSSSDLSTVTAELTETEYEFTGEAITPLPVVKDGDTVLVLGTDYTLDYTDNVHVNGEGVEPTVIITFIGNYSGTKELTFDINPKVLNPDEGESFVVTPESDEENKILLLDTDPAQELPIEIYDGDKKLEEGVDYEIVDSENEGEKKIVFEGDYEGNEPVIVYYELKSPTITGVEDEYNYTGDDIKPLPVVTFGDETLLLDTDYTLSYSNNKSVGENASVTIVFIGDYADLKENTKTITFAIVTQTIDTSKLDIDEVQPVTYDGTQHKPTPTVYYNGVELEAGVDFDYSYGENINAGEGAGKVTITFKGGFSSNKPVNVYFDILAKDVTNPDEVFAITPTPDEENPIERPDTGEFPDLMPIVIHDNETGKDLVNPDDFEIVDKGDGVAEIVFKGNYDGTDPIEIYYHTNPIEVEEVGEQPYTGGQVTPEIVVHYTEGEGEEQTLEEGVDYILHYGDNDELGTGTVTIEYIGKFDDVPDEVITFTIGTGTIDENLIVVDEVSGEIYDGTQHTPTPAVYYNDVELTAGKDFIYTYGENVHAGENAGSIIIKFIGGFDGNDPYTVYFDIIGKELAPENITIIPDSESPDEPIKLPENGTDPFDPDVEIIDEETGELLIKGEDYDIIVNEETGEITIDFKGDYEETEDIVKEYEKVPGDISDKVEIDDVGEQEYDPNGNEPKPGVHLGDKDLEEGEDFEYQYGTDEEGNPEVIIVFHDPYSETPDIHIPYEIVPKDIENPEVIIDTDAAVYTGEEVKPGVTIKDGDTVLQEGIDYVIYYLNNDKPGEATVLVEFIGNYANTPITTSTFDILNGRLDNSSTTADGRSSVIVINEEGFDPDISVSAVLKETVSEEIKDQEKLGGRFYGTYGDYEIKLLDKDGNEIQPSDIKEGTVLTLMIELPDELKGRDVKIVHYHSADDISIIVRGEEAGIGTYIITEEGYLVTQINKFSDFALIYEETCLAHWFMITAAVLNVLLIAAIIIMGKKQNKIVGIATIVGLAVITGVSAIFAHCMICWVMLGVNGLILLFDILFFALWKGKEEPQQVQPAAQPQVVYVQAPAAPVETAPAPVAAQPAPVVGLSLVESIAHAQAVNSSLVVTKALVAAYLSDNYKDSVTLNRKENYTSTGLPLADTHYVQVSDEKKACFIYVFELKDNKSFFLVRTNKETYEAIKAKHPSIFSSAFPRATDEMVWYSVNFDESYKTLDDVYEVIKMVLEGFGVNKAEVKVEVPEELTLHDSMEKAAAMQVELKVTKELVANYLTETYKDGVVVNRKANYTKTGLPLADTHYVKLEEKNVCVMYVYELNNGSSFLIVKTSDEVFTQIKEKHLATASSLFPHTNDGGKWFTVMFDESYKSIEDVQEVIDLVINAYLNGKPVEAAPEVELSLHDQMEKAAAMHVELKVNKELIANYLLDAYKNSTIVNRKPNYTKTGLPLADTHYVLLGEEKKACFMYVYELNDGNSFIIVKTSDEIYKAIKAKHGASSPSAFPHTNDGGKWYSVMFDSSFKSEADVHEVVDMVINGFDKTPAPVKEEPKPVEPEPVVEADESQDGINYMYKFSFSARLIRAGAERQDFYNEIKNEYLSYKKVNSKISWGHEFFKLGRIKLGQMKVKGKTLCVYLPLDPKKYDQERLWFKETGDEEFPMMMQVKSDRAVKYVKELIADVMANNEIPHNDNYEAQDYRLPEMSIEEMLAANPPLAKLTDGSAVPVVEKKPEPVVEKVEKIAPSPVVLPEEDESGIDYKYKFSFSARLIRAGADRQDFYNTLKNEFLAYKKVASKISWGHELFKLGRIKLGQMKVKGKTLCVYLPLDPKNYDQERFHFKETGDEEFPMMMKVTSDRAVKYVIELLVDVMKNSELPKAEGYVAQDYRLPEMSIEEMLKSDPPLAKENTSTVNFNK